MERRRLADKIIQAVNTIFRLPKWLGLTNPYSVQQRQPENPSPIPRFQAAPTLSSKGPP
ncbi:hypothetical protein [Kingella oralis]|uniref:hypothetical protein n=1 Tax=Kingella oralis TaxID=505 RepID=UPI003C6F540F